ncbi:MAG: winged helix-turn-helix domain-containing protein [Candidatus Bathyarchaeota archaeon]|nr:winged helix-turn-helix domain-containing protein [Candidatus Bathyarchaeota archaeon]
MGQETDYLHKILKDKKRRKLIRLLNNKGSLCYTDLLEETGEVSTGLLNYHLKVLADLVTKDKEGSYVLTEKGKLACRLLTEGSDDQSLKRRSWEPRFWKTISIFFVGTFILTIALYFLGYITLNSLYQSLIWIFPAICVIFVIEHIMRDVVAEKNSEDILQLIFMLEV